GTDGKTRILYAKTISKNEILSLLLQKNSPPSPQEVLVNVKFVIGICLKNIHSTIWYNVDIKSF
ncbi:hypothetical protein, partial [Bacillus sp. IT-79MI2]|uniref:hypothetical protein n=1 Tax=Bacillus sp. IT-79MI2 TaxID=3026438 RepID=UPI0039DFC515